MTDKLKELVAKCLPYLKGTQALLVAHGFTGSVPHQDVAKLIRELEAILAEQAPVGGFDAWWSKYIADVDACQGKRNIARDAYAAGRSSQPVETRDPAAK